MTRLAGQLRRVNGGWQGRTTPSTGNAEWEKEKKREAHRRISSTTRLPCRVYTDILDPRFAWLWSTFRNISRLVGRPDAALPVSLQFADSPTARNTPVDKTVPRWWTRPKIRGHSWRRQNARNRVVASPERGRERERGGERGRENPVSPPLTAVGLPLARQ